jgi:hypothetical protein
MEAEEIPTTASSLGDHRPPRRTKIDAHPNLSSPLSYRLIELLDGANLLSLLDDHPGIQARIEVPETWVDPVPDMPSSI